MARPLTACWSPWSSRVQARSSRTGARRAGWLPRRRSRGRGARRSPGRRRRRCPPRRHWPRSKPPPPRPLRARGIAALPHRGLRTSPSARRRPPPAYGDPVASVLVIEDDQRIREALAVGLSGAGHAVRTEATGGAALAAVVDWQPDVVVLDLGLPDLDGADVLRMLRGVSGVPVIVATARDDEAEIVRLLDQGADDYVVKPYSATQLEARIRAVLRRTTGGEGDDADDRRRVGGLVVHPRARTASLDGRPL